MSTLGFAEKGPDILVKLPTGDWVEPEAVTAIEFFECQELHEEEKWRVVVYLVDGHAIANNTTTNATDAIAMVNQIAELVNEHCLKNAAEMEDQ